LPRGLSRPPPLDRDIPRHRIQWRCSTVDTDTRRRERSAHLPALPGSSHSRARTSASASLSSAFLRNPPRRASATAQGKDGIACLRNHWPSETASTAPTGVPAMSLTLKIRSDGVPTVRTCRLILQRPQRSTRGMGIPPQIEGAGIHTINVPENPAGGTISCAGRQWLVAADRSRSRPLIGADAGSPHVARTTISAMGRRAAAQDTQETTPRPACL
jgi:hypothetical protein